jgi:hypothetical protein
MIPPINATTVPDVGPTEFAMTSSSSGTTCGSAADSEERKNRFTPRTTSAASQTGTPSAPNAMKIAVSVAKPARSTADHAMICRRDHRSMKTPANGPISEYGRYSTANDVAAAAGSGNDAELKKT